MATRPWVTPAEVREYSEYAKVQQRTDARLKVDITRAEQYVISYTNNRFEKGELPEEVRTAVLLLAESYAYNSSASLNSEGKPSGTRRLKGETFDDYSWTGGEDEIDIDGLDVNILLEPYVLVRPRNGVTMKLRKL